MTDQAPGSAAPYTCVSCGKSGSGSIVRVSRTDDWRCYSCRSADPQGSAAPTSAATVVARHLPSDETLRRAVAHLKALLDKP